jgi:uncharacterized protein involved in type VI secretion and phage assembly
MLNALQSQIAQREVAAAMDVDGQPEVCTYDARLCPPTSLLHQSCHMRRSI